MKIPEHLDAAAIAKWGEVFPILQERGDVGQGVADALAAYCVAYSRWTAAEQQVGLLGLVVKSPAGFAVENPYLGVSKRALIEMHRWGKELGIVTRTAKPAKAKEPEADQGGGLLRLLGGTAKRTKAG